jgi:hypothetical protein
VHASLIYVLIIPTNCSSVPLVAFFLGYINMHKGFKCLDVVAGRIYVSCDLIFDETVFPFGSMQSNAGARYHSVVLLEPPGNSAITNSDYASTMTLLPVMNLDVQVPIGSSLPSVPAAGFPGVVLTDVLCAPASDATRLPPSANTGAPAPTPDAVSLVSSADMGASVPMPADVHASSSDGTGASSSLQSILLSSLAHS